MIKLLRPDHIIKTLLTDIFCHLIFVDLILVFALVTIPGPVFPQDGLVVIPANSHARAYRDGWECGRGFRAVDEVCLAINLPANVHLIFSRS